MRRRTRNYLIWGTILIALGVLLVLGFVEIAPIQIEKEIR